MHACIDDLIAGCGKTTATVLQLLKETGARIGEVASLEWINIDFKSKKVGITPEKGSNPRVLPITDRLIAMLKALRKREVDHIFNQNVRVFQNTFRRTRNRLAKHLQNPRLKQIHFHTLRHWKGTTLYQKTKDILHVKHVLGHKRLDSTDRYTHYISYKPEEYTVRRPRTSGEEDELIEAGFQFVRYDERSQEPIYRKRK